MIASRIRVRTHKVDKALLDVDVDEFDSQAIPHVEALSAFDQLSLDGRLNYANPRSLLCRPGHLGVEDLADAPRKK
jgi:hypothetical protein